MSLDADVLIDRRRLRRKLTFWRVAAFVILAIALIAGISYASGLHELDRRSAHIARIPVEGMILEDRKLLKLIEKIGKSNAVKGVVLSVNSPGGSTTGGEALYEALRELSEKKPVVAEIRTIGTSAAYMISLSSDHIVARYNSITGSIGVLFQFGNAEKLLETIGIEMDAVKSADLKAEPDFYSTATPEARAMLNTLVTDSYDWFVDLVAERRGLDAATARELADGRILSGHRALEEKLVDAIGGEAAAISWLSEEKQVAEDLPVVTWRTDSQIDDLPFGAGLARAFGLGLGNGLLEPLSEAKGLIHRGIVLDGLVSVWQAQGAVADN